MNKLIAEFIGTAVLVLIGCGAAVLGGDSIGQVGISLAFGLGGSPSKDAPAYGGAGL